ncbi:unnamed protein product [Mytilus edulis]|uniref:Uncharacterized protein n=1 Tax=Mytilus edulis TaxID=6550 RepID=A0A8S3QNJ6_MYTED|nr:unnamed protein product [Mytilus edulis]
MLKEETNCRPVGSTTLVCESPEGTIGTSIKYGLILDGVTKYGDLSTNFPQAFFNITSNPTVQSKNFDDYKMLFSDNIIIQGTRLKEACEGSLKIMIGSINCKTESSTNEKLHVDLTFDFPGVSLDAADVMVKLEILIIQQGGSNLYYSGIQWSPIQNGFDIPMYNAGSTSPSTTNLIQKEEVPSFPNRMYSEKHHLEQALSYDETDCSDDFLHKIESSVREKIEKSISDRQNIEPGKCVRSKIVQYFLQQRRYFKDERK